ncbi:MAG: long-chain fatty acid--CoA ligase [Burkholderiaceae bacterium]|nr:long-chain fatty acid--CoA ligase [Burkholderiaceae bacterium]
MNLTHQLIRWSRIRPHDWAIFHGARPWASFVQWADRSARLASAFRERGLEPGDRVLFFAQNHPRYLELLLGCWWAGLVAIPVNARLHHREVQWIIDNAQPRIGFLHKTVSADQLAGLEQAIEIESDSYESLISRREGFTSVPIHDTHPDDTVWLFYTSGTTGRPKGVQITARNLLSMGLCYFNDVDPIAPKDIMAYAAPMSHGAGLYSIPHLIAGARHVVPASGGVDPAELFELGRTLGPLSTFAAPTIVNRIVDYAEIERLSFEQCAAAFKTIVYGGAPMYVNDIQRALRVMGPRFVQIYGQGETPMVATALSRHHLIDTMHPRHLQRIASVGVAQTPVQIRIADAQGQALPTGEIGEVLVRGDTVMRGYWNNESATRETLRDGWLFTGDVGSLDEDGFLTLRDRSKDLIISGGSNIYPREIEEVLMTAPEVAEAAVVGAPDAHWGETIVAFVVAKPGQRADAELLDQLCKENIARFKRPKRYVFVTELPKNNYGKVLKTELRDRLARAPT